MKSTVKKVTRASRPVAITNAITDYADGRPGFTVSTLHAVEPPNPLVPTPASDGCSPTPADAPHYIELGHTVRTATQLEQRYNTAEWTVTRRRTGVPSATEEGYGIDIELRFADANGELKDIVIALSGDEEGDGSDLSTADFRRLVSALNAAAAALPPVPGLLTEPAR